MLRAQYAQQIQFPRHWDNDPSLIRQLNVKTEEFKTIETEFKKTIPNAQIIKVERIQNKRLWQQFLLEQNNMLDKLMSKEDLNIRYHFHGTRKTSPSYIYKSEQGFNGYYSNDGMWGRAIYFAAKASYSHDYRHTLPDGTFQMFQARVILGKCKEMIPDSSLREPPFIEGSTTVRYDSVQGITKDTDVFMVYSNAKAYPEYLITYKLN
ncbi:hypothetical protein FGO68_gene14258 [Halteria grandinella]|uniref:Poly [ADP-ribose] polymerase n=1 Tax=Halteria grandinella TaxID=5974 RepID=A0A8J8NZB7_HALGN|nr:hypothetical protein FGO68_gene14258 [Halteria grandinella]